MGGIFVQGISVQGYLCPRGISVWGISVQGISVQGIFVQGYLCPGYLCPGYLCPRGISVRGIFVWGYLCPGVSLSGVSQSLYRVLGLGTVTSILFHATVDEKSCKKPIISGYVEINGESSNLDFVQPMEKLDWFKEPQFYLVAGVYMSTRLFVNLSQAYLPLYLQESLKPRSTYVATIPVVLIQFSSLEAHEVSQ